MGPPSGKDKRGASGSASATSARDITNSREYFILWQNVQQEQPKHLFLLVSSLSRKIESVVEVAETINSRMPVEPPKSDPPQQEKAKASARNVLFEKEVDDKKEENENGDDKFRG